MVCLSGLPEWAKGMLAASTIRTGISLFGSFPAKSAIHSASVRSDTAMAAGTSPCCGCGMPTAAAGTPGTESKTSSM